MNVTQFRESLETALSSEDWSEFRSWTIKECCFSNDYGFHSEFGYFSKEVFTDILELLMDDRFLQIDGSWHVLYCFETEWSQMTDKQKHDLFPNLELAYPKFKDKQSLFIIAELLGAYYNNAEALDSLLRIEQSVEDERRAYVPFGLGYLARHASDLELAQRATDELVRLSSDALDEVRAEALDALQKAQAARMPREETSRPTVLS